MTKPTYSDNKELNKWMNDLYNSVNFDLKSLFVPVVSPATTHGTHSTKQLTAGVSAYFELVIPDELKNVKEVNVRLFPTTTGSFAYTFNVTHGKNGEDEALNTGTKTETGKAVTDDQIYDLDVTSCFSTIERQSSVGCQFTCNSLTTTTNLQIIGLVLRYL
jgi:hypothetical protein